MATKKLTSAAMILTLVSALFALMVLAVTPAYAHHKEGHDQGGGKKSESEESSEASSTESGDKDGDADSDPDTAYTEDNDTNDGGTPNNVEDEGDNQHPSGKDRSVENGGSGNQGKSESHPDDSKGPMRYEGELGPDKPNGPGGTDLADQDGNNGCGNDDDFDDDNNGWCGKPETSPQATTEGPCDTDAAMPGTQPCEEDEVLGGVITSPVCDKDSNMANGIQPCESIAQPGKPSLEDDVLGGLISRPAAPEVAAQRAATQPAVAGAALPFTGGSVATLITVALGLLASGILILRARKLTSN